MNKHLATCILVAIILSSCATKQNAPVIERSNPSSTSTPNKAVPNKIVIPAKDWRPDTHTVKKGDTLFSIGLQYGYDYKEIAQANNISPPYTIKIGQVLKLGTNKIASVTTKETPAKETSPVVTPLKTEPAVVPTNTIDTNTGTDTPMITSPKSTREVYSDEAFSKSKSVNKPVDTKSTTASKQIAEPTKENPKEIPKDKDSTAATTTKVADGNDKLATDTKSSDDNNDWVWPTKGKVITQFSDSTNNKGIDIAGVAGQAVNAAGDGKVIYNGSDLRGYGKLVIIKHSKDVLSVYAHNNQILVKEGQLVTKGQKIAEMGNTDTDKVKLHFEIRLQGKSVDPVKYLPPSQ